MPESASRGSRAALRAAASIALLACACGFAAPVDAEGSPPLAAGRADREVGPAPLRACFEGAATARGEGGAVALAWDFGDGSARAEGHSACHVYAEPGSYAASLEARDAAGRSALSVVVVTATGP
jgi:PKD repeat protein